MLLSIFLFFYAFIDLYFFFYFVLAARLYFIWFWASIRCRCIILILFFISSHSKFWNFLHVLVTFLDEPPRERHYQSQPFNPINDFRRLFQNLSSYSFNRRLKICANASHFHPRINCQLITLNLLTNSAGADWVDRFSYISTSESLVSAQLLSSLKTSQIPAMGSRLFSAKSDCWASRNLTCLRILSTKKAKPQSCCLCNLWTLSVFRKSCQSVVSGYWANFECDLLCQEPDLYSYL